MAAAKRAAQKAQEEEEEAEKERKRRAEPFLNETAFDRRKLTAVYKTDGSRGHHMGVSHACAYGESIMHGYMAISRAVGGICVRQVPILA